MLTTVNGYIAYNHYWVPSLLSSSVNAGYFQFLDNDLPVPGETNKTAISASFNLKYDPVPELRLGIEYSWANRELLNGTNGSLNRIQFSAKYRFGFTDQSTIEK